MKKWLKMKKTLKYKKKELESKFSSVNLNYKREVGFISEMNSLEYKKKEHDW